MRMSQGMWVSVVLLSAALLAAGSAFAAPPAQEEGKKVYESKCASCHGKDGKGNPAVAKMMKVGPEALNLVDAETRGRKDAELIKITTEGKGSMPSFQNKLSKEQIAGVIAYIRSLKP